MLYSSLSAKEYEGIRKFIENKCGISLGEDKAYLIESRLSGLLVETGLASFEELYRMITCGSNQDMIEKVIDAVTTNETFWFRDRTPWYIFEDVLLPLYIQEILDGKRTRVRIWSAACSSGQEPYSTAMCIDNYLNSKGIANITLSQFDILATDISNTIIQMAGIGRFDNISITRGLSEEYKEKYFKKSGRVWSISDRIKSAVHFQQFNLQKDFSQLGQFDVVFCRNVLIYFSEKLKREVVDKVALALEKGGILFIGSSELFTGNGGKFTSEQYRGGIYYKVRG